jgi:deoxyribodipyrimidine photolyase-related protein
MNTLGIIFPDQLYIDNPVLNSVNQEDFVLLYEPIDTFYEIAHHKHKLIFLISSIRHFKEKITHKNILHRKITDKLSEDLEKYLYSIYTKTPFSKLVVSKPSDFKTLKDLMYFCQSNDIELEVLEDKKFITSSKDFINWSSDKKSLVQEYYYRYLRKKFDVLMMPDGKPTGNKWNLDK